VDVVRLGIPVASARERISSMKSVEDGCHVVGTGARLRVTLKTEGRRVAGVWMPWSEAVEERAVGGRQAVSAGSLCQPRSVVLAA